MGAAWSPVTRGLPKSSSRFSPHPALPTLRSMVGENGYGLRVHGARKGTYGYGWGSEFPPLSHEGGGGN